MHPATLAREQLRQQALGLGFTQFGIVRAQPSPHFDRLHQWLESGFAGTMDYIAARLHAYQHPKFVLPDCKSIIMLVMPYDKNRETPKSKSRDKIPQPSLSNDSASIECRVGSYASGTADYHDLLRARLNQLADTLAEIYPGSSNRGVVDTAPLMERDFAQMAGLGWIGKNTLLLNRDEGSYFFLAALLTTVELSEDESFESDHCGSCTACLDACPTDAFQGPRVLNAARCISYLTIEHRGVIEADLSDKMQDWIFGCDVCQIVCPWNRKRESDVLPELVADEMEVKTSLEHWLTIDESTFRNLYRKTPFWRTKLVGMQRNAMIAAANTNRFDLLPHLQSFLQSENEVLQKTSDWAVTKLRQSL